MDARLRRRVQRFGWDLAADHYEPLWRTQLAGAHEKLLACARLAPGQRVLDVACGTGSIALRAARAVGRGGHVTGIDLSDRMVALARTEARVRDVGNVSFTRMDAESLDCDDDSFDAVLCSLGLMYVPDPGAALAEMLRVVRPGGRVIASVWGSRAHCGWSDLFPIVDAEVRSEVCPLFFSLGEGDALERECRAAGLEVTLAYRLGAVLEYADVNEACSAAFAGGPAALAWSRFSDETRCRVSESYARSLARWRHDEGYSVPGEFVVVAGVKPG